MHEHPPKLIALTRAQIVNSEVPDVASPHSAGMVIGRLHCLRVVVVGRRLTLLAPRSQMWQGLHVSQTRQREL